MIILGSYGIFRNSYALTVSSVEKWPNQGSRGLNLTAHPYLEIVTLLHIGDPIHRLYI
jgi:hypothetical protein